jgi:glutaredoxin
MNRRIVTVYGKAECHLCDEALAVLRRLREETPFELVEIDVTGDDALHKRYLERIPVIAVDGTELYDYFVDEDDLRARLSTGGPRAII